MPKPRQNYFDQMIRQYGDDFIQHITPGNIQKSARTKIFRDMVQGNIDYSVYGKYFQDPKFFENLLIAAYDELQNNNIIFAALDLLDKTYPGDNRVSTLKGRYSSLTFAYSVIYGDLQNMKMDNYNVGRLANLAAELHEYRNLL